MAIYPSKKIPSGKFGFNLDKIGKDGKGQGTFDGLQGGVGGGIGTMAGNAVSNIGKQNMGYGVSFKGVGSMSAGEGLKGAGAGYEIGKNFGPKGAIIGAAVGAIGGATSGLIKGKRLKREAHQEFTQLQGDAIGDTSRRSRKKYGTLQGFSGAKYKDGGKLNMSVILGGRLHKDGGNMIIHAKTKKPVAETEKEELFLNYDHTKAVEKLIEEYDSKNSDLILEELGRLAQDILMNQTIDNSGRFTD